MFQNSIVKKPGVQPQPRFSQNPWFSSW